ncbi:MAG TPA: aldehyde dehydrogenase family protein, partial [Acidimicrobiales bacterium]|nr:aldehyde dehydrogenase family protein [Acidimicrobiales bacterium]
DAVVTSARAAQRSWAVRSAAERAAVLRRAADELEARRGQLVTVMAAEGGKTVAEADPEVSEAVDFARYYADRALDLDPGAGHPATDGARFTPPVLTLVTPPWNFPVAIPIGGVLAALAAGSAVVIKPAHLVPRCTEVAVAALHAALASAGVAPDVLRVVRTDEGEVGRALVAHPGVDTVILTGAIDTARLFSSWRAGRDGGPRVLAETSGKNTLVITPSADVDLAVADLVRSAFGHAGQKCSAASLVVLVGSAGTSERLRRQLVDAVRSVRVGWPADLGATMGPLIEPPTDKLERALTRLDPGESWLVEPRLLDDTGRLWSPGLKDGVAPGSFFHLTECFGPVLGIMRARTLAEAVELQNATAFGLTGGLHALDEREITEWLATVEVGNAYVNRHITGAIVQRQPFGGWKDSVVGPGAKAGGPNYVAQLGTWTED